MGLIVFPAIDLREGRVVRLLQGDPARQTVYGDDPAEMARHWEAEGAEWLHVVNLDGALDLRLRVMDRECGVGCGDKLPINLRRLADIRASVNLPIQFGGGIRTLEDVERALDLGAARVVLGTVAVKDPSVVERAVVRHGPERVVVGLDARDGLVATHGWQETSALSAGEVARRIADLGVQRVVYTDIARDGMLEGVNATASVALARQSGLRVIASGGVASLADIHELCSHTTDGVEGVIVGRALYTGAISLREASNAC